MTRSCVTASTGLNSSRCVHCGREYSRQDLIRFGPAACGRVGSPAHQRIDHASELTGCRYRGESLGRVACGGCAGDREVEAFHCEMRGIASIHAAPRSGVACCLGCEDFIARDAVV